MYIAYIISIQTCNCHSLLHSKTKPDGLNWCKIRCGVKSWNHRILPELLNTPLIDISNKNLLRYGYLSIMFIFFCTNLCHHAKWWVNRTKQTEMKSLQKTTTNWVVPSNTVVCYISCHKYNQYMHEPLYNSLLNDWYWLLCTVSHQYQISEFTSFRWHYVIRD